MLVVFFTEGSNVPARRFRVEHFLTLLKSEDINYIELRSWPSKYFNFSFRNRVVSVCSFGLLSLIKSIVRILQIPVVLFADVVFIQRELLPYNIIFLERFVRVFNKNIIFDLDDSIFLYKEEITSSIGRYITQKDTIAETIRMSRKVICGNSYLAEYAKEYNRNIVVIPTVLDAEKYVPAVKIDNEEHSFVIGWMGTSGNLKYLLSLQSVFSEIHEKYPNVILRIVTDKFLFQEEFSQAILTEFKKWSTTDEVVDLQGFDLGLMPLFDDKWTRGKCGFKILQYMATGVPVIASAVGANKEIIQNKKNGFLVSTHEEWKERIIEIIENKDDINERLSLEGRKRIEEKYSIQAIFPIWVQSLKDVALRKNNL